jgi:hypothetical protein
VTPLKNLATLFPRAPRTAALVLSMSAACSARQPAPAAVQVANAPASQETSAPPANPVELLADGSLRLRTPAGRRVLLSAPLAPCPFNSTAIPFQYFVEACSKPDPSGAQTAAGSSSQTALWERYFATAHCVLDRFRAKPYWQPELLSNTDVCEATLGRPWHMLNDQDAAALAGLDTELQAAVPRDPRAWYFGTFDSYARTSQGALGTLLIGTSRSVSPFRTEHPKLRHEDNRLNLRCVRPDTLEPMPARTVRDDARSCGELLQARLAPAAPVDPALLQKPPPAAILRFETYIAALASKLGAVDVKRAKQELSRIEPIAQDLKTRLPTSYALRGYLLLQLRAMDPGQMTPQQRQDLPRVLDALRSAGTQAPPDSQLAQRDWESLRAAVMRLSVHIRAEQTDLGHTKRLCEQIALVDAGRAAKIAPEKVKLWRREVKQSGLSCSKVAARYTVLSELYQDIQRVLNTSPQALLPPSLGGPAPPQSP